MASPHGAQASPHEVRIANLLVGEALPDHPPAQAPACMHLASPQEVRTAIQMVAEAPPRLYLKKPAVMAKKHHFLHFRGHGRCLEGAPATVLCAMVAPCRRSSEGAPATVLCAMVEAGRQHRPLAQAHGARRCHPIGIWSAPRESSSRGIEHHNAHARVIPACEAKLPSRCAHAPYVQQNSVFHTDGMR